MANPRIDDLRKRLDREPGSRLFAQLAEELRKDGDLDEAIRVARDGLQKHPAYPSARMTLGRALLDKGELAPARTEFEAVLKGAPDNILASRFLAECLEGLGDLAGAVARYKSTLLLSPGDRQVQSRLEAVEEKLRRPAGVGAGMEPRPIPVAQVDEPMVLEAAHEGRVVKTGEAPSLEPPPAVPAMPVDDMEESFELERAAEARVPSSWQPAPYTPEGEVVFEPDEAATIPPGAVPAIVEATPPTPMRTVEFAIAPPLAVPAAEAEVIPEVEPEPLLEPELPVEAVRAAPEPASVTEPPLASPTLAELYLNQGFTDKAMQVYRQLQEREPGNERVRARLQEIEAMDRHLRAEEMLGGRPAAPAIAAAPAPPDADPRARRREAIERTIARLEGFLAAVRKG